LNNGQLHSDIKFASPRPAHRVRPVKSGDTDARLWHPWLRINRVLRVSAAYALERGGVV